MLFSRNRWFVVLLSLFAFLSSASSQTANIGANFQSITLSDLSSNLGFLVTPPDTQGAIGTNHFTAMVNGAVRVYDKTGVAVTPLRNETTFWTNALANNGQSTTFSGLSDPRLIYDPLSQRWFSVIITTDAQNSLLIARTDTADPTGTWKAVRFQNTNTSGANSLFIDYPTLGIDANGLYIGTNNFNGNTFANRSLYSIPKSDLLGTNPTATSLTRFENLGNARGFTPHAVTDFSPTAGDAIVMSRVSNTTLGLTTISGSSASNATLSSTTNITVQSGASPGNATQPTPSLSTSSSVAIDAGDNRIGSSVYRVNDKLYMVRTVDLGGGGSGIRFTVINATNNQVIQENTIGTSFFFNYYPAVAVNSSGDVVIGFTRSGFSGVGNPADNLFAGSYAIVGTTTNNIVTFGNMMTLRAGATEYQGAFSGDTSIRWGDYSQANVDPTDPGIFWVTQEFTLSTNRWGTQATEIIPTKPGEIRWQTAASGSFNVGSNYFNGNAPIATDHAIFSRWSNSSYQIDLPSGTTTVDRLSVRQTGPGTVTFNIPSGNTLDLTNSSSSSPSLSISEFQGTSKVVFSGGGTLQSRYTMIAGQAGGVGNLTISGNGTNWNNLNDVYLGGTSTSTGGTGSLTINNAATATIGGTLFMRNNSSSITVGGSSNSGTLIVGGLTNNAGTNPNINLANSNSILRINGSFDTNFSGNISGSGQLQKESSGTFTLSGNSTYSGNTFINNGRLLVDGQTGSNSGTGTSAVVVNTNGTLGGTGQISGNVTIQGVIAPGTDGIGSLKVGNTTFAAAGTYQWQLADASGNPGTGWDLLSQFGTNSLSITSTPANPFTIQVMTLNGSNPGNAANFNHTQTYTWTIAQFDSINGFDLSRIMLDTSNFTNTTNSNFQFSLFTTDGLLQIRYGVVPEPSHILLIGCIGMGLGYIRRRREDLKNPLSKNEVEVA
jgi:autotransporter-associated beta strand protein/T5SS/PEP-CTERM-associated repeat protein